VNRLHTRWRHIGVDFERDVDIGRDTNFEIYYYYCGIALNDLVRNHSCTKKVSQRSLEAGNRKWEMTLNIKMSSKLIETRF
jgi:hypothetical protein